MFKAIANPILLIGDAPELHTGLARIGRDLAQLLSSMPEFRVGYLGRGAVGSNEFAFMQYSLPAYEGWGQDMIRQIWQDFAHGEPGIIMTTWDASRMLWFGNPIGLPDDLSKFLGPDRNYEKWGYFPFDGDGPQEGQLPYGMQATIAGYDRVLCASEYGLSRAQKVQLSRPPEYIPHGLWLRRFKPLPLEDRLLYGMSKDAIVVGCVMTNQARKDWPVAFETAALLKRAYNGEFRFWVHVDKWVNYWHLPALVYEYGLNDCVSITTDLTEDEMVQHYALCDVTILPSGGEGFGYPIAESMACGTPCVATAIAAGENLLVHSHETSVPPVTTRIDTIHNVRRAVLNPAEFFEAATIAINHKRKDWEGYGRDLRALVEHLDWDKLKHVWVRWFREGIGQ